MSAIRIGLLLMLLGWNATAQEPSEALPANFHRLEFVVEGVTRETLLYLPAQSNDTTKPLVFVFHGHGGSARQIARNIEMSQHWPEAISVYMQGLNTPGQLTDPEGRRAGWQSKPGDQGDRDLKFFDAVLAQLKSDHRVDEKRIYATGHSNGGGFTYLLWAERGDVFAAMAPSAAVARYANRLKPKPAMLLGGKKDALVRFAWQEMMMDAVLNVNGCVTNGERWGAGCTRYASSNGTSVIAFVHSGGHAFDRSATPEIVKFFKEHPVGKR